MSVRLDRLQKGLFEALTGIAPHVLWARQSVPREQLDSGSGGEILKLDLIAGPTPHLRPHVQGVTLTPASSITVTVTGATVGKRNIVRLNGFDYRHDTEAGDTTTDIRDALLASIVDGEAGAVTATASGAAGILLTADFLGGLRSLDLVGQLSSAGSVVSGDSVTVSESTMTHVVNMQAFSRSTEPRAGATQVLQLALDELRKEDVVEELSRYGLALWDRGSPTDVSAIAGASWESRATADIVVAAKSVIVADVDSIEEATVTISLGLVPGGAVVATAEATATAP